MGNVDGKVRASTFLNVLFHFTAGSGMYANEEGSELM
jgi:hypothetical protein